MGLPGTLEARAANQNLLPVEISSEWDRRAEVLSRRELYCLFSFAATGKQILGRERSFDEWLEHCRDYGRRDLFWLAKRCTENPVRREGTP